MRMLVLVLLLLPLLLPALLLLLLLLLLHRLHPRLLLFLCLLLELLDELRHRHPGLLGVAGELLLHGHDLLAGGHLPGLRRALHGGIYDGSRPVGIGEKMKDLSLPFLKIG